MTSTSDVLRRELVTDLKSIRAHLAGALELPLLAVGRASEEKPTAAWLLDDGSLSVARGGRPATCGEVLAALELAGSSMAERESAVLRRYVDALVEPADRAEVLERVAPAWPWSCETSLGLLYWKLREYTLYRYGPLEEGALLTPGSDDERANEWLVERLTARPMRAGDGMDGALVPSIYRALPDGVQHAWHVRKRLEAVARGDAQRYLLETIAPDAIKSEDAKGLKPGDLAEEVRSSIAAFKSPLLSGVHPASSVEAEEFGLKLTAEFCEHVKRTGAHGAEIGKLVEKDPWKLWLERNGFEPFLVALARAVLVDRVLPMHSRYERATPMTWGKSTELGYRTLPKSAAPISWAFGGQSTVKVDGDTYAQTPDVAKALVPRSWPLLKGAEQSKPHQAVLAFEAPERDTLPVAVVGATQYAITPTAAKVAVLALANDNIKRGHMQSIGLGELAQLIHPSSKRIQARELEATSAALDELRRLFVYLPDGGKVPLFGTKSAINPKTATAELRVLVGLTSEFLHTLKTGITGPALRGGEYRGEFLVNLDGMMRISNKRPSLLRHSIRAYAHWNAAFKPGSDGRFDASRMPAFSVEKWAALANSLPPGVVEYLAANEDKRDTSTRRAQLTKERKAVLEDLDELEAMGLVRVEKLSRYEFKLLPPESYLEAWRKSKDGDAE
jgi:hypothetical protein